MKFEISRITIVVLVSIIVLLLCIRVTSSYAPGTPASSLISQPVFDSQGNYQDINPMIAPWTTAANYVLDPGNPTWSQANINCWARQNCAGIRHNFDGHQTWYLMQPIGTTSTSMVSVMNPVVQYNGQNYSLPLSIVANKSIQNPSPTPAPSAHGIVTFSTVGPTTWTVPAGVTTVHVLVVGGGGGGEHSESGGSNYSGGGGGAGGVIENTAYSVTPGASIQISVGGGGGGGIQNVRNAQQGGDSAFGTLVAKGGGGGGTTPGNGGGGSIIAAYIYDDDQGSIYLDFNASPGGTGIPGQMGAGASAGITGTNMGTMYGGAGGGAGGDAVGANPGPGRASSITGTSTTYSTGGLGSWVYTPIVNGVMYGDGGGGAPYTLGFSMGGNGSQGVVIVSY